ncbi:MAG: beta-propeller fold lactonase family protein [Leptospiraceae bacterium]|nr:beta-propeller fold lactonase family protein [Leptospiraceae bacterium]
MVSVVTFTASNTTSSTRLNTNVNPLTNMGAGKFSSLVKYRLSANQLNPSIHSKNSELILQTLSNADLEGMATTANEYIGEIFFGSSKKFDPSKANLSDPTSSDYDSTNAKVFLATLGGIDSVVSDVLKGKGISDSSGLEVTSSYNSYTNILMGDILGDGKLDGKNVLNESGSALVISSEYTAIASSPLANIASGMKSYLLQASSFTSDDGTGITWTSSDLSNSALIGGNVLASGGSASAIAYLSASYTLARGVPMSTLTPVIASTVTNCISTPALPTGLSINATTCAISGTPASRTSIYCLYNLSGKLKRVVNITILSAPTAISLCWLAVFLYKWNCNYRSHSNDHRCGDNMHSKPTLPTGLSISATCVISGTPSQGTALTDYTITATNVAGSISAVIRMRTFFSVPKFAYSLNYATHDVSAYSINSSTGALTSAGTVVAGTNARGAMADPTGKFLYVVSKGSSEIRAFSINPTTGGITLVGGPVATKSEFVFIHPTGKFAYVANNGGTISYFSINTDGTLNSVGSVGAGSNTYYVRVDREGKFAYAVSNGTTQIFSYSINQATGALTQVGGPVSTVGGDPRTVEIDPTNTYMYSANFASNAIALFTIHPTTGLLTYVNSYATSILDWNQLV